jgi:hypothetical protein
MIDLDLPKRFYNDHRACGLPSGLKLKELSDKIRVRLDREAYDDLLDDARHYITDPQLGNERPGLRESARATKQILESTQPPKQEFDQDDLVIRPDGLDTFDVLTAERKRHVGRIYRKEMPFDGMGWAFQASDQSCPSITPHWETALEMAVDEVNGNFLHENYWD